MSCACAHTYRYAQAPSERVRDRAGQGRAGQGSSLNATLRVQDDPPAQSDDDRARPPVTSAARAPYRTGTRGRTCAGARAPMLHGPRTPAAACVGLGSFAWRTGHCGRSALRAPRSCGCGVAVGRGIEPRPSVPQSARAPCSTPARDRTGRSNARYPRVSAAALLVGHRCQFPLTTATPTRPCAGRSPHGGLALVVRRPHGVYSLGC